ncbi:MAG TPA: TIR domain-containing protein, partial [Terriglobales bacterium]|nr:TIR domain-containing protein [Terriglobales bacterium]
MKMALFFKPKVPENQPQRVQPENPQLQAELPQPAQPENVAPESTLVPSIGRMPFPAYRGSEPYIFISYAHLDADMVFREIKRFNEQGYNVWYDEGISPGNEWTGDIARALENCSLFVVFITPNSADSLNVLNEINFALGDRKPFIAIHLTETVLKGGLKLQISSIQAIMQYKMTDEEYVYKYTTAFTGLGMRPKPHPAAPGTPPVQPEPQPREPIVIHAKAVGDYRIDHGLLHDYLGEERALVLPDEVQIVGALAFAKARRFIETVDLNKTGALLNGAFSNCPRLREVRLTRSVTMIQERPFVDCPQLTLYCYKDQLPPGFAENFGGKEIVYLDGEPQAPSGARGAPAAPLSPVASAEEAVVFSSPEMHRIVCAELGCAPDTVLTRAQCDSVTALQVCGNAVGRKFNTYINDGKVVRIVPVAGSGEQMATVSRGALDSLADIPLLRNLATLVIPYQSVYDLTPLANSKIEKLDLSANMLDDISPLGAMRFLTDLFLNYAQCGSLEPLNRSRSLARLNFSGIRQSQFDE